MKLKPLSPTNDFVFRKIFGENRTVLEDFLKSVLDLPAEEYKDLEVVEPSLDREFFDDKLGILDIKVNTRSGKVINVEIQVKLQSFIWQRVLFYVSKMVVEQVKSGYQYDRINRVVSIIITDFVMVKENDAYHNRFRLYDENTGARFPDSVEVNTLELPKMHEIDGTPLGNWMRFFKARTEEDFMNISQTSPAIKEACGMVRYLSGDERTRALAEAREKARMDLQAYLHDDRYEGRQEGLQEGRQEGLQEGIFAVAKNLLRKKMTHDDIADATGLSIEEVKKLAARAD
jgi:predicted transposase/invertase (TIGR01784 family)